MHRIRHGQDLTIQQYILDPLPRQCNFQFSVVRGIRPGVAKLQLKSCMWPWANNNAALQIYFHHLYVSFECLCILGYYCLNQLYGTNYIKVWWKWVNNLHSGVQTQTNFPMYSPAICDYLPKCNDKHKYEEMHRIFLKDQEGFF